MRKNQTFYSWFRLCGAWKVMMEMYTGGILWALSAAKYSHESGHTGDQAPERPVFYMDVLCVEFLTPPTHWRRHLRSGVKISQADIEREDRRDKHDRVEALQTVIEVISLLRESFVASAIRVS